MAIVLSERSEALPLTARCLVVQKCEKRSNAEAVSRAQCFENA